MRSSASARSLARELGAQQHRGAPPLDDLTPEEQKLKGAWGLDDDQIRWRRGKQRELRDRFAQEYPEDDVTCFLASGRCCFDIGALMGAQARIASEPTPEVIAALPDGDASLSVAPARQHVGDKAPLSRGGISSPPSPPTDH
jgi:hypothetical protein